MTHMENNPAGGAALPSGPPSAPDGLPDEGRLVRAGWRWKASCHESGHILLAHLLGIAVGKVELFGDHAVCWYDAELSPEAEMMILAGGLPGGELAHELPQPEAPEAIEPEAPEEITLAPLPDVAAGQARPAETDVRRLWTRFDSEGLSGDFVAGEVEGLWFAASAILKAHRGQFERLASELYKSGNLGPARIRELLEMEQG